MGNGSHCPHPHTVPGGPSLSPGHCSPVPELPSSKVGPGLVCVQLQQDLSNVEGQEEPLHPGDDRALLIEGNEDGIEEDDDVINPHEHSGAREK